MSDCQRCQDIDILKAELRGATTAELVNMVSFIVCPTCGNKRCPKATYHDLTCTGSNEVGQPGSDYQ